MSCRALPSSSKDAAIVVLKHSVLLRALVRKNVCIYRLQKAAAKQNRDLSPVGPASAPRQLRQMTKAKSQPPARVEQEWYGRYSDRSPKRSVTPQRPKKRRKHADPRAIKARGV